MRNVIRRALHPRRAGAALLAVGALTGAGLVSPAQANAAAHIRVHFISLYCETTEDSTGPDEPYLLYNGQRMWGNGSLNDRQSVDLNLDRDATGRAYVRLYDADTGIFDSDDFLGEVEINDTEIGMGTTKKFFTEDGAKYTLYYEVLAD